MRDICARWFHAPGDWLVEHTTERDRRSFGVWLFILWVFPGLPLWILLRNALWFVGFMSIFALWWTGLAAVGAETPSTTEDADE